MSESTAAPAVLDLDDPLELLAYLPYRLGFWPEESAVFFSLRRQQGHWLPGLVARADLSDLAGDAGLRRQMMGHLVADGARIVFMVIYTSEPMPDGVHQRGIAGAVARWWLSNGPGADPGRVWVVCGRRYRCLECDQQPCCPATGHPLELVDRARISAEMVFSGAAYAPSRDELVQLPDLEASVRDAAIRAAARWRRRPARQLRAATAKRWDAALRENDAGAVSGPDLGALLAGLDDPYLRDAVLLGAATGESVQRLLTCGTAELLERIFAPGGVRPEAEQSARATNLLQRLAAAAARGRAASAWAVLGWLAWFQGHGARADLCLQHALAQDPDHRLGWLVRRAVDAGIPPGWARGDRVA